MLLGGAMAGGLGNDTCQVDNALDAVVENADALTGSSLVYGVDMVESSVSYTLGNNVENITLVGKHYTKRISNFLPHAAAYLRKVATDGDCFSLDNDASKRETAGGFVPMRSAICTWVKPDASRAVNSASSKASSSRSMRNTAWRNAASFIHPFTISSCDSAGKAGVFCLADTVVLRMIHLLFTSSGNLQITFGRGFGFFDKAVQHHNSPLMHHAVKHAGDAAGIFQAQLEQPATHRTAMRHSQVCTVLFHSFSINDIARPHIERQTCHIEPHRFAEIMNCEHGALLTDMLTMASVNFSPPEQPRCHQAANDAVFETRRVG